MLKELVLSLILSAYSAAPFLDSPKKTINRDYEAAGDYSITLSPGSWRADAETPFGEIDTIAQYSDNEYRFDAEDSQDANIRIAGVIASDWASVDLFWYFLSETEANAFYNRYVLAITDNLITIDTNTGYVESASEPQNTNEGWETSVTFTCDEYDEDNYFYVSFSLVDYRIPVNPNFTFENCYTEGYSSNLHIGDNLQITIRARDGYGLTASTQVILNGVGYSSVSFITESEPVTQNGLFEYVTFEFYNINVGFSATFKGLDIVAWSLGYDEGFDYGETYPTDTAYQNGYTQGERDGYRTGYEDGKRDYQAGGIWSWFESASVVLSSFLNIPIFPGFTIGGLVGALVGLSIILFFVRAFLFKG